jgi:hypothetical protein
MMAVKIKTMMKLWLKSDGYLNIHVYIYMVGGFNHLEKYEFVNGKDYPIYDMENRKCSKPRPVNMYIYIVLLGGELGI